MSRRDRRPRLDRRQLMALAPAALAGGCLGRSRRPGRRCLVLAVDGMDHGLLLRFVRAGKMPNFARLMSEGGFSPLITTDPPQSPVAWSSFSTGLDPGGHGIFDFLRHDPATFAVAPAGAGTREPRRLLGLPLWGGGPVNLRDGRAFWEYLEDAGVPATVFRVPGNYPPVGAGTRSFAGMGTPDLRGTDGTFTYYTDDPPPDAAQFSGGEVVAVSLADGTARTWLEGPPEGEAGVRVPLAIHVDPAGRGVRIDLDGRRCVLMPGEWSGWHRVRFPLAGGLAAASGIVRFLLKEARPKLRLYASPVNLDPAAPALPLSSPGGAIREQAEALGAFYTQGLAEDTKALQWGVLNDGEFLAQLRSVLAERWRLMEYELERFRRDGGFLFFYFSTLDQGSHALWRTFDPAHPARPASLAPELAGSLPDLYAEMDRVLGRVQAEVDRETLLLVLSDHGFAPFYRAVHLNTWLEEQGFLFRYGGTDPAAARLARDVDWRRTRAYAVGFNGIFLNQVGREAEGLVAPVLAGEVVAELKARLEGWVDAARGRRVVAAARPGAEIYHGAHAAAGPDLEVGYARGYRASWSTPLGGFGPAALEDNLSPWSGDHLMASSEVPAVLLANRPLRRPRPTLLDLPVTILEYFGLPKPDQMSGGSVFREG